MDKPWGLEKRSAEHWEELYWQSIKRYPEMNEKYQNQQQELARLHQTIAELTSYITTLDGFSRTFFNTQGQSIYFDFQALRDTLVRKEKYIQTIKNSYQNAVQMLVELRKENDRLKSREAEGQYPSIRTSKYV